MPATSPAAVTRHTPVVLAADLAQLATQDPQAFAIVLHELADALADARYIEHHGPYVRAAERCAKFVADAAFQYGNVADDIAADLDDEQPELGLDAPHVLRPALAEHRPL